MSYEPPPNGFRTFLIAWVTQSMSVFGSALTVFATNIWLAQVLYARPEQKPELAAALAAINLAFALPIVFAAPVAGAWADRHDRKRIMMAMDLANGCLSLILASLLAAGALQLWMLLLIVALFAGLSAFHGSAFDTSYAMLVPEKLLPRANGMMQTMWSLSGIISPAVAAAIIALPALARQGAIPPALGAAALGGLNDGTSLAITIDAITFFGAAITLLFLHIPSPKRTDLVVDAGADKGGRRKKSIWADVKEGALFIWHRRPLLWLLGTFTVANLMASPLAVFQPLLVKFNLVADWSARGFTFETAMALLGSVAGIGGVVGGLFISAWGGPKTRRVYGVVAPLIIAGLAQVVVGLSTMLYLTAATIFLIDAMLPIMNSQSQAIWQTQTPRELQGRVFAVRRLIAQFTWPISAALAGWAGGAFNPGAVVAVLGAVLAIFCAAQLFNPHLLRVEDKEWLDGMAAARARSGRAEGA